MIVVSDLLCELPRNSHLTCLSAPSFHSEIYFHLQGPTELRIPDKRYWKSSLHYFITVLHTTLFFFLQNYQATQESKICMAQEKLWKKIASPTAMIWPLTEVQSSTVVSCASDAF